MKINKISKYGYLPPVYHQKHLNLYILMQRLSYKNYFTQFYTSDAYTSFIPPSSLFCRIHPKYIYFFLFLFCFVFRNPIVALPACNNFSFLVFPNKLKVTHNAIFNYNHNISLCLFFGI